MPTQQRQAARRGRRRQLSRSRCPPRRLSHDRNPQTAPQPQAGQAASASAPAQPRTPSPPNPETAHTPQAPGAVPVWDPPPPPAPKQSVLARLGFGRKAEPPEASPTTQPGQQQPAAPATQPAPTSPGGTTASSAQTGPVLRRDRRLVRRSSSARRLETRLVHQPVQGPQWPLVWPRQPPPRPLRPRRSAGAARTAGHASGAGPASRNHRPCARRTG